MELDRLPETLYGQFAEVAQALANGTRLRIANFLCQKPRSVDELAQMLGQSTANTSAHLQVLRRAHLVTSRKEGRRVIYALAGERALRLWLALRDMGLEELPQARDAMRAYAQEDALMPELEADALLERVRNGELVLLDLRPRDEYDAAHLPDARSIPAVELEQRLDELPRDRTVVAYCRGPFCVAAIRSVAALRAHGLRARRLRSGIAEWRAANNPVETGRADETAS